MQSCVHSFFFFAQPTDSPSREGSGLCMGNETFYGDGHIQKKKKRGTGS